MKATQKTFAGQAQRAARECRVFYFCGPDEAGASDAAARISELLGPAEKVELAGADLRRDSVRLADEARSVSLFGDVRQIHVRTAGDEAFDAVEALLASPVAGWPVLIVATSATEKSRIAKLLGDREDALVAMFHQPDLSSVAGAVRVHAGKLGLKMGDDMAERIARNCALDTRMVRSELEKLALFLDADPASPRQVTPVAVEAISAASEDDGFMPVVNAVLGGELARVPAELARMRELGMNPVGLLLAFERRVTQLVGVAGRMGKRTDINAFVASDPRVFFRERSEISVQLRTWRGRRLERLVDRLAALHRALIEDNRNGELVLSQGLADIARAASRQGVA